MEARDHGYILYRSDKPLLQSKVFLTFLAFAVIGMSIVVLRFVTSIGYVSNLNDAYPWGVWIGFGAACGTAFASGALVVAAMVYILNKGEYTHLLRSAILVSALGYGFDGIVVIVDLGRYWNMYHYFLPGSIKLTSSILQLGLSLTALLLVYTMLLMPTLLERLTMFEGTRYDKFAKIARRLLPKAKHLLIFIIALAIILPSIYQSSLGSLIHLAGYKVHPLWHTDWLPLLFLLTGMLMGTVAVMFETSISAFYLNLDLDKDVMRKLAKLVALVAISWVILRVVIVVFTGKAHFMSTFDTMGMMFWLEIILLSAPSVYLLSSNPRIGSVIVAAMLVGFGAMLYRVDSFLVAFNPGAGWTYFPTLIEFLIIVGIVSFEIVLYLIAIRVLPVLHSTE